MDCPASAFVTDIARLGPALRVKRVLSRGGAQAGDDKDEGAIGVQRVGGSANLIGELGADKG